MTRFSWITLGTAGDASHGARANEPRARDDGTVDGITADAPSASSAIARMSTSVVDAFITIALDVSRLSARARAR